MQFFLCRLPAFQLSYSGLQTDSPCCCAYCSSIYLMNQNSQHNQGEKESPESASLEAVSLSQVSSWSSIKLQDPSC